jgi:hypothetical protein
MRAWTPRTILVIGFVVFVLYGFPGFMSTDSFNQLVEARTGEYSNAHPPFMAFQWTVLDAIVSGPILMLLLQGGLLLAGLYALVREYVAPRAAAVTTVALFWFPANLAVMAVIWKDSQMAAYLVAGTALMLSTDRRKRVLGLVLVSAGCAFRHNGFAAAMPLVGLLFVWNPAHRWWRRYLIAGGAAIAVWLAAVLVNQALTVKEMNLTPTYADIVGVLAYCPDRTDEDLRHVLRDTPLLVTTNIQATARRLYSPRNSYYLSRGPDRMFDQAVTPQQLAALDRAWRQLITEEWRAYLAHRTRMFEELLGLSEAELWSPVYFLFVELPEHADKIQHDASHSELQWKLYHRMTWLVNETPFFDPWFYAALSLCLLVFFCRERLPFALIVSGLLYELSFFPTAGTPDNRYSHWMTVCTCVALVLIVIRRMKTR